MSFYKEVPGRQTTLESTLKFDTEPKAGSTNPVTSDGVKSAIDGAVGYAAENLQDQIDEIAEKAGSGYIPKGEATVATLNALSGQENGELYTMTDAGTLTLGSLAVVAGDTVAWDATNEVWYKAMDYAPRQYGTNEAHNLPTTITAFRTGDVIPVDGPDGTAKMSKDDLLKETAENALAENVADFLKNRSDWTTTTISSTGYEIPSDKRISSIAFKTNKNIVNKISSSNYYWLSKWSENGSWVSTTVPTTGTATLDADSIYRITAHKDGSPTLTDGDIADIIQSFSFERNFVNTKNIDIEGIGGECIKGYPFAMHNILSDSDFWIATTISNSGKESASTKRISSKLFEISDDTGKLIINKNVDVYYWVSKYDSDGNFIESVPITNKNLTLTNGFYRITARKVEDSDIDATQKEIILLSIDLRNARMDGNSVNINSMEGNRLKDKSVDGNKIKDYPFAEVNILGDSDFWSATTISNSGEELASTTRISSKMMKFVESTQISNTDSNVLYWVSEYDADGNYVSLAYSPSYLPTTLPAGYYRITAKLSGDPTIDETKKEQILASLSVIMGGLNGELIRYQSIPKDRMEKGAFVENGLNGKVLVNFGGSIANGAGANGGGAYAKYIAAKNGMKLYSYAVNGMVLAEGGVDTTSSRLSQQITSAISNIPVDDAPQFILFEGGTNDLHTSVVLGDVSTTTNAYGEYDVSGCDTDTYCGAFEVAVSRLRTQWPSASIIFVMVHEMTSRDIDKQHQLHEKQIALCNKWKIPYVDMFNEGQMTSLITATAQTFFPTSSSTPTGYDRTHPNELGYKKFYCPKIEAKMRETYGWDVQ